MNLEQVNLRSVENPSLKEAYDVNLTNYRNINNLSTIVNSSPAEFSTGHAPDLNSHSMTWIFCLVICILQSVQDRTRSCDSAIGSSLFSAQMSSSSNKSG